MQETNKKISDADIESYLQSLMNTFQNQEICELVRADLDAGISLEDTKIYSQGKGMNLKKMKQVSGALHRGEQGKELVRACVHTGKDCEKLAIAIEVWDKGLPFEKVLDGISETATTHDLKELYNKTLQKVQELTVAITENQEEAVDAGAVLAEVKTAENSLRAAYEKYDGWSEKLDAVAKDAEEKSDYDALKNRVHDLETENAQLKKQLDDSQAELSAQQTRINDGFGVLGDYRKTMDSLKAENETLATQAEQLAAQNKELAAVKETLANRVAALEAAIAKSVQEKAASPEIATTPTPTPTPAPAPTLKLMPTPAQREEKNAMKEGQTITVQYALLYPDGAGRMGFAPVEQLTPKPSGMVALLSTLGFKKKSRRDVMRLVANGKFTADQLIEIGKGMEEGLTEEQMALLVNPALSTQQMQGLVRIGVCQNKIRQERSV